MTQRRQTRASASLTAKAVVSKRQVSKENAPAPRTRGAAQSGKNLPTKKNLPSKTVKKMITKNINKVLRRKATTSTHLSTNVTPQSIAPKRSVAKKSEKPSVTTPVASKSSTEKSSAKPVENSKQRLEKPVKVVVSSERSLRSSPKKTSSKPLSSIPSTPKSAASNGVKSSPRLLKTSDVTSSNNLPSSKETAKTSITKLAVPLMKKDASKRTPSKKTPSKQTPSQHTPSKQNLLKRTSLGRTALTRSPARRSPLKEASSKQSPKSPRCSSRQSPSKQAPALTPSKRTPKQNTQSASPNVQNRCSRKRLLPSPAQSPHSTKVRRLRGKEESPVTIKIEQDSEDDCVVLDEVRRKSPVAKGKKLIGHQRNLKSTTEQPPVPELSNSFLRRKWFSLKAKGGFTCLRSAILSPQEVVQEVIEHTNIDQAPANQESDFFTTKLMVRLSSRLPPVRVRPSCEELVDLINSKHNGSRAEPQSEPKKEGTAIRVKLERRSFNDTLSHIRNKPVKTKTPVIASQVNNSYSKPEPAKRKGESKLEPAGLKGDSSLSKKQEREIALRQLKDMSAPETDNPGSRKDAATTSVRSGNTVGFDKGRRWFSLKSHSGSSTSLRSAILSPEELAAEFMKRTKVDPQTCLTAQSLLQEGSRGSYKGVSTDELVNLIQSRQMQKHLESLKPKVEEVKEQSVIVEPEKILEKEMALQQLNVLRYW